MEWSIWKMSKKIIKEINTSIFKPYLIHVEFEILNILTQLKLNDNIKKIYESKRFNYDYLIETTEKFLYRLRNLIKALQF